MTFTEIAVLLLPLILALCLSVGFMIALVSLRDHLARIIALTFLGLAILASFIEQPLAIPAYVLVAWLYASAYSRVEGGKLKETLAKLVDKSSLRYYEVLLGHRLVFLALFVFVGGMFLNSWGLHNLENLRWVWWTMVLLVVFRGLGPLVDEVLEKTKNKDKRPGWRKSVFVVAVTLLAMGALRISEYLPANNDFLKYLSTSAVSAVAIAAFAYDLHPRAVEYCATKLNKHSHTRAFKKALGFLAGIYRGLTPQESELKRSRNLKKSNSKPKIKKTP